MNTVIEDEYVYQPTLYIIELTRDDVIELVHAANMHAERLDASESKRLMDAVDRLSGQAVYYQHGS